MVVLLCSLILLLFCFDSDVWSDVCLIWCFGLQLSYPQNTRVWRAPFRGVPVAPRQGKRCRRRTWRSPGCGKIGSPDEAHRLSPNVGTPTGQIVVRIFLKGFLYWTMPLGREPPDPQKLPILQGILMGSGMGMGVPLLEAPGISIEFGVGNIRKMENFLST